MSDVTDAWEAAAQRDDARIAIHPSALRGGDEYERSGEIAARKIYEILGPDLEHGIVADFGCGDGRVTIPLARLYAPRMVAGVDASPTMLTGLRRNAVEAGLTNVGVWRSDGTTTPPPFRRTCRAVVALAVLIHHRHADAAQIIMTLTSWLTRDGQLLLDLPLYEEGREPESWTAVSVWTLAELEQLAERLHLEIVHAAVSPGAFEYDRPGPHHGDLVVLQG